MLSAGEVIFAQIEAERAKRGGKLCLCSFHTDVKHHNFKPSQIGKDSMDLLSSFNFFNLHQILHCFLKLMEKIRVRGHLNHGVYHFSTIGIASHSTDTQYKILPTCSDERLRLEMSSL